MCGNAICAAIVCTMEEMLICVVCQNSGLDLAREVAEKFRVNANKREEIIRKISKATALWKELAVKIGISRNEMQVMEAAFHNL